MKDREAAKTATPSRDQLDSRLSANVASIFGKQPADNGRAVMFTAIERASDRGCSTS
jgi:hypothetical protein